MSMPTRILDIYIVYETSSGQRFHIGDWEKDCRQEVQLSRKAQKKYKHPKSANTQS